MEIKPYNGVSFQFSPEHIDAMADHHPVNVVYLDAIRRAQGGLHDNVYKRMRYFTMYQLARKAAVEFPTANMVECGCRFGHSTLMIEHALKYSSNGTLHVFDSFEGLSMFGPNDESPHFQTPTAKAIEREHFRADPEALRKLVDPKRVRIHQGWIPDVLNKAPNIGLLSFANIDVDLYQPTADALRFVYPKLLKGGLIFFDDYGTTFFPGATKAIDEFVAAFKPATFLVNPMSSAFLIK